MKLHLGCGKRHLPGYVHVDIDPHPHVDVRSDIRDLSAFDDESADLIYSCHAFEYFDRKEAVPVLAEWRRVLKPGGVLRLAVPDFEALAQVYLKHGSLDRVLGPLYGRIEVGGDPARPVVLYHKTTYDFPSLAKLLHDNGFRDARRWDWRKVLPPGYDDFSQAYVPHMDKENGLLVSLNVEATK